VTLPGITNTAYELVPTDRLHPYPHNPRRGDLDLIVQSIQTNGFYGAIVAAQDGTVLIGNHRLKAALQLGMAELPVIWTDLDPTSDQARRMLLVDNRANDVAGYDEDVLATMLRELPNIEGTGFTPDDLDDLIDNLPDFETDTADTVRLDRKSVTTCPKCGHDFVPVTRATVDDTAQ